MKFAPCLVLCFLIGVRAVAQNPPANLREYRDRPMSRDGDIRHGKELFFDDNKCGCARCHSVDGTAAKAGPDLFTAGDKFPRRDLIRAILEPSESIAIGYATTIIETKSGEEYAGVIKQVTDQWTELMLADGSKVRINAIDIKEQRGSNVSFMPEGLHGAISAREFTDLVEYVSSLKEPQTALAKNRGTPAEIPELVKPVLLVPFFSEQLRFPHAFVHKPGDVRSGLVWFGQPPGFSNEFIAVHQTGKIWLLRKGADGDTKTLFADIAPTLFNERGPNGLLSIAFHPKFRENRKYYVKHQVFEDGKIATVLAEREAAPDLKHDVDKRSRRLLKIVSTTQDHSGGCIEFGPDGYLYLGMGDTGPQQDPQGHGQDMQLLLSKIIRIDVDHHDEGVEYAIPADNPFRGRSDARPEIWAYGFREPWRFTFDRLTGDLWVGDVGQDRVEEVAIVRRGENHGWNVYEGFETFSNRYRRDGEKYVEPVFAYRRQLGNSITGGYVYRDDTNSSFYGVYICGDYTSKRIWGLTQENRALKAIRQIAVAPQFIASFGTDQAGNIYVVGYEGMVYKIDFQSSPFDSDTKASGQ